MGLRPPSPAPSIDGLAQLRQYIDTGAATLFIEPNGLDTGVAQANAEDPSRYRAPNNAGRMASYNGFEKGAETLATMGYSHDNGWALHLGNQGQDGQTSLPSSNHYAAGAPFGAALGDSDQYNLVGLVSKRRLSSLLTVKQDKVPFTPESSPPVGDCGTTRTGVGLSKRLRAVPDATRARRPRAASRRRNQAGAARKSFFLRQPLSEISAESGDALVFDVDSFVHRPPEVRKQEQKKQGKVKRPLNDFVLYRKAYSAVAKARVLSEENKNNQQLVSQICGESWGMETAAIKATFKRLANVERTKHFQAFPDYKYAPKLVKKGKGETSTKDAATTDQIVASSHHGSMAMPSAQMLHPPNHVAYMPAANTMAMGRLPEYAPVGPYWYQPGGQQLVALYGVGQTGYPDGQDRLEHEDARARGEAPPQPTSYELQPSLQGMPAQPLPDLCIDPSLLPRAGEPAYQYVDPGECVLAAAAAGPALDPELGDNFMTAMPDLDVDGAHNAYLRGTQGDWEVEFLDEGSHFNDWMAQEEHANLQP